MSGPRRKVALALPLILLVASLAGNAAAEDVSTGQQATERLYYLVLIPAVAIGVLVVVLVAYAVIKFRVRPGHTEGPKVAKTHDSKLESLWTVIPALILLVVGVAGFQTLLETDTIPTNPDVIIEINAHQWFWEFNITHVRNGTWLNASGDFRSVNTTGLLTVKAGLVVKLILRSFDVIHSFYVVDFLLKVDVVPGHPNVYWFKALQPGMFDIKCAELCGVSHYSMTARLQVVP